jgi:acetyl esterase/lipase
MRPPLQGGHRPPPSIRGPIDEASIHPPEADVSSILRKWLDLPYANRSRSQKLDLFLPEEGDGPFPVILHIHGGAFAIGDKRDIHLLPYLKGLARGYAVASINYRLSGEAIFPAGLQDIKAAIRWLRANADRFHLDPRRFAACGGSSGGNYAAMVVLTADVTDFDDPSLGNLEYPCDVQAGVDQFGPTDFLQMDEQLAESSLGPGGHSQADSPESRYLGAKITGVPDLVRRANPMTYIHEGMPPLLIQHGRMDHLVPYQQSLIFAEALGRQVPRDRFELDILDGADHGDPAFETDENSERVFRFLEKHLGKR